MTVKGPSQKHIIVQFQNARNRDLKASREKEVINKGGNPSACSFLTAAVEAGSQWRAFPSLGGKWHPLQNWFPRQTMNQVWGLKKGTFRYVRSWKRYILWQGQQACLHHPARLRLKVQEMVNWIRSRERGRNMSFQEEKRGRVPKILNRESGTWWLLNTCLLMRSSND